MNIYNIGLNPNKPLTLKGQYGEVKTTHLYVLATSHEHALNLFRRAYPDARVHGVSMIDYYNGVPVLTSEVVMAMENEAIAKASR